MNSFITINDLKISYQKRKRCGKSIIFIHNSSGSSALWDKQWQDNRFADYTLIRFDLPGHGLSLHSNCMKRDYSLSGMAQIVDKTIKQLQTDNYIIVASSLATNLVGEIASQLKGCNGFFLAGTSIIGNSVSPADILLPFEHGSVLFETDPSDEGLKAYVKGLTYNENEEIKKMLISDFRNTDPHYRTIMGSSIAQAEWTDELQNLKNSRQPVAWLFGKNEQIIDTSYLNKMTLDKWNNEIFLIEAAGHLVNLDQPGKFNELLQKFAKETLDMQR